MIVFTKYPQHARVAMRGNAGKDGILLGTPYLYGELWVQGEATKRSHLVIALLLLGTFSYTNFKYFPPPVPYFI